MSPITRAAKYLRKLERSLAYDSQVSSWRNDRDSFLSDLDRIESESDLKMLFELLRKLECSVQYSSQNDCWKQWKRDYWKVMSDPDLDIDLCVTRFIICMKYMEENLQNRSSWDERDEWLNDCNNYIEPVDAVSFHAELSQNADEVLSKFGFSSLNSYIDEANSVIRMLESIANDLDETADNMNLDITSGVVGIVSGVLSGAGIIMAPFTAGGSLVLTGVGTAMGVGSVAVSFIGFFKGKDFDVDKANKETNKITGITMALSELLNQYADSFEEMNEKFQAQSADWSNFARSGNQMIQGALNVSTKFGKLLTLQKIPLHAIAKGHGARLAFSAAAPRVKIPFTSTTLIKKGTSFASTATKLNAAFSVFTISYGIYETKSAVEKKETIREMARNFRNVSEDLADALSNIKSGFED